MKSGDILGGIASSTNTVTGVVQGLSSNITKKDGSKATLKDIKDGDFKVNNNYYANAGVNLGFNKSSSESKSHNEFGVVTTIKGKDKNSSITYNNVKNIEYVGTQAQNTKFIYNNVENITKKAVELNNYSSSSSRSSGISAGVTIGYGDGTQTSVDAVKFSASQSKMNSNGTNFQNGRFVNVDEVHNNTKNMTLSGFNQEGGTVTGNIQNLTIESKQNTSNTTGSTKGGSLSIAPNGMPSGSINYSQTNGERKYVDNATTFLIGDGSNLKISKVDNTAAAIGATGNGKLSIDEYVGHNLENVDKSKTVGGSVGISTSGINSIGINYNDRKQEGITKNTVIGNVEIGKSSGDEINKDLASMTEVTKDRKFETNVNIESQTIKYALNPEAFKQDLAKAKDEITDIGNVVENTINPKGEDSRNIFANLRAQRWNTSFYNVTGSRMEELSRQFKAGEINANQLKEAARDLIKGYGKDIGIDFDVVYLDEETMPKDSKGSTGSSYILDKKNKKVLIPIDVNKIEDINELLGTLTEEVSHGKDALEGRQDKKVAEDKSNDEEGLESLGRPANDYVKNKLGEDNNSKIKLSTDGINLTNADVGEKVGDVITPGDRNFRTEYQAERSGSKYIQLDFDRAINGIVGLTGSVFRGKASYGLIKSGITLLSLPEPTLATKIAGGILIIGGGVAAVFTISDAVESGQNVYYGATNQKEKKSVNFGRRFLGEDSYDTLNMLSAAGMPILYQYGDYTRVIAEGEAARDLIKGYGKDIGIDYEVVYLDEETMPKDSKGSTGSSYILDKKNKKVLIPIDVNKIEDINELLGTLTEEVSHGKDALEGRQDKKVAEDKSNDEEGLESLGRPANDYVKNKLGEDNNSKIKLLTVGTRFLNGKEIPAKDLIDNAASIAKKNGLTIGKPLTKEQIAKLDKDIVWYEYQNVDGIQVLAPKVYLSQNTLKNLNTDTRSRITGLENTYVRTGNLENTGLIGGYGNTYVEAKEVNNRTLGNQLAEIRGNKTTIIAQNNINNIGAKISGNESLNLVAINGDIVNKSTVEKIEFNNGEFDRSKFTKIDSVGEIVSNGNMYMLTNNYTSVGAVTQAKNANINVTNDINIKSQEVSGEQKFGKEVLKNLKFLKQMKL